jgi:hypothetical protein
MEPPHLGPKITACSEVPTITKILAVPPEFIGSQAVVTEKGLQVEAHRTGRQPLVTCMQTQCHHHTDLQVS